MLARERGISLSDGDALALLLFGIRRRSPIKSPRDVAQIQALPANVRQIGQN